MITLKATSMQHPEVFDLYLQMKLVASYNSHSDLVSEEKVNADLFLKRQLV